jgi:hypothetical protein
MAKSQNIEQNVTNFNQVILMKLLECDLSCHSSYWEIVKKNFK